MTVEILHRRIDVGGVGIFYREAGPKDAPVILLLHGFPTSSHMFRNLIPALADTYRVIAPDYPGYGNSSMPNPSEFDYSFDNLAKVVDKFVLQLELQLADQNVHIQFDSDARVWLGDRGYDRLYGARPMSRLIQEKVKQPLAEELLSGKLVHGGEVKVKMKTGEDAHVGNPLTFEIIPAAPKAGKGKAKAKPEKAAE